MRRTLIVSAAVLAVLLGIGVAWVYRESVTSAAPPPVGVRSVDLVKTGGFAGSTEHLVVDQGSAYAKRDQLFQLVQGPEFRALDADYTPAQTCCDRFSYTLTVSYTSGAPKTVKTLDGAGPSTLWTVLTLVNESR